MENLSIQIEIQNCLSEGLDHKELLHDAIKVADAGRIDQSTINRRSTKQIRRSGLTQIARWNRQLQRSRRAGISIPLKCM